MLPMLIMLGIIFFSLTVLVFTNVENVQEEYKDLIVPLKCKAVIGRCGS